MLVCFITSCICWSASFTDALSNLQQVTQVSAETFGQVVQQLAECQVCTGGEGVGLWAQSAGELGTSLQHSNLRVLLHNATYLRQQQIQMLKGREEGDGDGEQKKQNLE